MRPRLGRFVLALALALTAVVFGLATCGSLAGCHVGHVAPMWGATPAVQLEIIDAPARHSDGGAER